MELTHKTEFVDTHIMNLNVWFKESKIGISLVEYCERFQFMRMLSEMEVICKIVFH
jgi:hypothetical protein